ncbi:methyl-accepting chemotaxis protein [Rubrivivax gelatinosus]|uniref:methyl-accepting chemotaxis protein n=1 Tax=Rubrivivax gelatinosus TaxID=28068 RepID=UPI001A310D67|nr:methyl-accepting chemotaxis protein [Rubrivivax gelatinosus]MBG6082157.1 methyl-accepting chemotaxis protein [Rubrivivax gelatinosus]
MLALLDRWSLSRKLALIGVLAFALLVVPGTLAVTAAVEQVRQAKHELQGLAPATALMQLARLTAQHRGLSNAALGGNADAEAQRAAVRQKIDAASTQAREALATLGDAGLGRRLKELVAAERDLTEAVAARRIDPPKSFQRHTELVDRQLDLLYDLTAVAEIVLHPVASGYFLQDATLNHLPQLSELLGQLRGTGMGLLVRGEATPTQRARVAGLVERVRGANAELARALEHAVDADASLAGTLGARAHEAHEAVDRGLEFVSHEVVDAAVLDHPSADWWKRTTEVIDLQYALAEVAVAALQAELEHYASARVSRLGWALALLVLLGAATAWLMWQIARRSAHSLETAIDAANAVAAGDLGRRLPLPPEHARDEGQRMLRAMHAMCAQLVGLVGTVRDNASQIATASSEIANGNADLSARTEQQAASLQQTAASMDEMTATVAQTSEHAHQASRMAAAAAEAAGRGGEVVQRVASTMAEIEAGSRRIGDIVGTIDSIAFQTNILALNAAVEAARAGEHGRGFAVVASEVRALSQRSAEAARQVRTLIAASGNSVEAGGTLARAAGEDMHAIVEQVRRVAALIAEITAASGEQTVGIGQVNSAVGDLDRTTQQNAALVEQSAAAADSLRQQAARLAEAVGAFRL